MDARSVHRHSRESTTTGLAGGVGFTAKGVEKQGHEVPRSLRVKPGAKSRRGGIWKTQSKEG
jgi:hypothetical protein